MTQSLKFDRLAGEAKSFGFFTVFLLKSDVIEKVYNGSSRKMLVPRRKTKRRNSFDIWADPTYRVKSRLFKIRDSTNKF